MKLVVAIIKPERFEAVQAALNELDLYLITVTEAGGCSRYRFFTEVYRGAEFQVRVQARVKLEIAVNDDHVETAIEAIVHAARTGETGEMGDGKIFVFPMEDCVRIRTGERGGQAIGQ
jgi:nitrogen regulatory protein P-II 2